MIKKYGRETDGTWDFFTLYFGEGGQAAGPEEYAVPGGVVHAPTPEQLLADGRRLLVDPSHDTATHKLAPDSYSVIDADTMEQDTIALAQEELDENALDIWEGCMAVLDGQVTARVIEDIYDYITGATQDLPSSVGDLMSARKAKRDIRPGS